MSLGPSLGRFQFLPRPKIAAGPIPLACRAAGEEEEVQGKGPAIAEALRDGWITRAVMTRSRWGKGALIPAQPPGAGEGTEG